ncbi:tRNA-2-methylthio-N(6)-dimethylallyladenosine synthase [Streptomyces cyaneofuscatus]
MQAAWQRTAGPGRGRLGRGCAVVDACGFVEAAKKDSVDALLEANDLKDHGRTQAVVAVGCMAERYGKDLAEALPEADGVLGFDDYADISDRLQTILNGGIHASHTPRDRRKLLPISPAERQDAAVALPGHAQEMPAPAPADLPEGVAPVSGPRAPLRRRLGTSPVASVKLASGCDRRCSFCAIPSFRGSFISRRPSDVLQETRWLAEQGVKEVMLVKRRRTLGADWGVATTGVAGPEPQDGQPVGTVYVAVAGPSGVAKVSALRLNGSRADIRRESVRSALDLLAGELGENARAQDTEQTGGIDVCSPE